MSAHGLGWKSKAGASETVDGSLIVGATWTRLGARIFQLELSMKGGASIKFDGFREQVSRAS
jgi:hypothetical protein